MSVQDISEARAAEAELRESEARFRNMADNAPVMTWVTDASGNCTYLNVRWHAFTGQTPEEAEGFGWLDATHPADKAGAERIFLEANAKREPFRLEYRLRRADGVYRWAINAATPRFDANGKFLGYIGSVIDIDDRREIEDALRGSEERLRLATASAAIGTWDFDPVTGELRWDERCKALFGLPPDADVNYETFLTGLHPDDRAASDAAVQQALAPEGPTDFAAEYRTIGLHDGVERWVAARGQAFFEGTGADRRAHRFIGTVIDITAAKRAEEMLEGRVAEALAERRLLADLVENTDAFVQVADLDFRWLAINKASADEFERIFGARPSVGQSMLDVLNDQPEHREAVRSVWARALGGEEFTEVAEFGDPGRERFFYEMKYNTLRDAQGNRIGAYQFVYDVTDRMREQQRLAETEAARREADALYRAYFENTAEALFVVNVLEDGRFTVEDLNPAHQASVGLPLAEVYGKRIDEILPEELAEPVQAHYRWVLATGDVYQYRETFTINGEPTYWDTVLVPVHDNQGKIVRLIGSSRDLTRQLEAEEQLRQAQKMESMGQLTGGVAHDFNNLLMPIIGSLDMLRRRGVGSEREQRMVDGALQSAERAKTLVQRLLAFARRQPLQPVAIDLGMLIHNMGGLIGSTLGPKIEIRVNIGEDLSAAHADANQLEMALLNLAVNARDAMPEGGMLTIGAASATARGRNDLGLKPGDYIRLSVSDTGTGMDEATLRRAVEPFFSTKGIGRGTGLGLSMVHGLAAQLGGGLSIVSHPGRGTTVELWLPVSTERLDGAGTAAATSVEPKPRGCAILVDDEELVRMSPADMLIDLGYTVLEAGSAEEAVHLLRSGQPADVLITDHLMPGMSGADLAREARRLRPSLPVLIVSGYAEVEGIAPDLSRLTKPFRNADLAASLAALSSLPTTAQR